MIEKQYSSFVLVRCQIYLTGRMGRNVAFGIFTFLTLSLSGGKPPSFEVFTEKLAWAISPSLSQGVVATFNRMNLVASDEVERNTDYKGKSSCGSNPYNCGVGKLKTRNLTK